MSSRGGGARRAPDPEVRHDAGDRAQLGAPRLRPARVHARRRGRRRARSSPATSRASSRSPRVLVPPHPGIIAATGLLATDLQHEFVATERHALKSLDATRLARALRRARGAGRRPARRRRRRRQDRRLVRRLADCRYAGQGYEVRTEVPPGAVDEGWVEELQERFHAAHEAEYGHRFDAAIEIVNIRVVAIGADRRAASRRSSSAATAIPRPRGRSSARSCSTSGGRAERHTTPFYERERLRAGDRRRGPGDRRAVRLDDGRSPRARGRDRPARQHRDRLHRRRTASAESGARRSRRRS